MQCSTIRREEPDDAEAVARVHVRGWQAGTPASCRPRCSSRLNLAAWAQRRRDIGTADPEHPSPPCVGRSTARVVGFATFGPYRATRTATTSTERYGEIVRMYVEPAPGARDRGAALLPPPAPALTERGWTELPALGAGGQRRARRFYERAGLSPDGERVDLSGAARRRARRRSGWPSCGTPARLDR